MVEKVTLHAKVRDKKVDKPNRIRKQGMIPGIVYGKGVEPLCIKVDAREFEKVFHGHIAENIFIDLVFEGNEEKNRMVFIKDFQKNPLKDELMHVDFVVIHKGERISTHVPIYLTGKAPGVAKGGILEHHLRELYISCLPDDLPSEISVDISNLNIDESIHVEDLELGDKIKILTPGDTVIVHIAAVKASEEEKPEEGTYQEAGAEPELVRKEKSEEEPV